MEKQSRRNFIKSAGLLTATVAGIPTKSAKAAPENILSEDRMGVLVDTTACIGCRNCEWACKSAHDLPAGDLSDYDDKSVFKEMQADPGRQPSPVGRGPVRPEPNRDPGSAAGSV